ncbi:hypothetical protein [Pseudomonas putida]|uniref:hypothetical protein n=1 Tax=Pseudomonas putida TaxID=303 RepID=UPI003905D400
MTFSDCEGERHPIREMFPVGVRAEEVLVVSEDCEIHGMLSWQADVQERRSAMWRDMGQLQQRKLFGRRWRAVLWQLNVQISCAG